MEEVFGNQAQAALPAALRELEDQQLGDDLARRAIAQGHLLRPDQPYGEQNLSWEEDVTTRLDADSVTLRLARWEAGRLTPGPGMPTRPWPGS